MAHTPTSSQLSKLATLQIAVTTAQATLTSAHTSLNAADAAYKQAVANLKQYEAYIYGNAPLPGTIDGGSKDGV